MAKHKSMRQKARERAQERESAGGAHYLDLPEDYDFFKIVKGRNNFTILPYEVTAENHPEVQPGELWYQRTMWVHYNVGSEEKTEICPLKTFKEKCPICERRLELMKDPDADDKDIDDLKPKEREMFNVLTDDDEYQLLYISYHNFGKLLEEEIREDEEYGGFADLEDGKTLSVRFKQETFGKNKFLKASKIDFKDRDDLDESILDDVLDLDAIMIPKSYDDLYNAFWDVGTDKDKDEDGEKKKKKTSSRKKPAPAKKEKEEKKTSSRRKPKPKPKAKEKKKPKPKPKEKKLECPEDLEFGKDFDEYECCDDCKIRRECGEKAGVDTSKEDTPADDDSGDASSGECPHGFTFGADCNKKDECDECNEWEACQDLHDSM